MGMGLIFWILMLLWLVLGIWVNYQGGTPNHYLMGGNIMLFILLLLLGWQSFGAPVH